MARSPQRPIGYGRPPRGRQFKKGQSGNPNGRPKGSKNLATYLTAAANEKVAVKENGRTRKIPKLEASVKQLVNKAVGGDPKSIVELLDRIDDLEARAEQSSRSVFPFTDEDREVIRSLYERIVLDEGDDDEDA